MTLEVIILRGLPGSGKSTYARKLVDLMGYKRVNKDDLRIMVDNGRYSPKNERLIEDLRDAIILTCVRNGYSIVVDDTNIEDNHIGRIKEVVQEINIPVHIGRIKEVVQDINIPIHIIDMDVSVDECIRRDAARTNPVGEAVIRRMADALDKNLNLD